MTLDEVIRWAREYPNPTIMRSEVVRVLALAAGTQRAETNEDLAQSEGCQSGPKGNAQTPSDTTGGGK